MRDFFLIRHDPQGLTEVYQENARQKRNLPDTRTIVQSLSNVKCRVVFWFFPLRRWRLTLSRYPTIVMIGCPPRLTAEGAMTPKQLAGEGDSWDRTRRCTCHGESF